MKRAQTKATTCEPEKLFSTSPITTEKKTTKMKKLRSIVTIFFLALLLGGMTSCEVTAHTDNGRHRGWFHKHDNHRHRTNAVIVVGDDDRGHR
jgi:heme A synthase